MKKSILLVCLLVAAFSIKIVAQSSDVTFFNMDGQQFTLIINGIKQNDQPQTSVKVTGLTAANYKAKVIFANASIPPIDKNLFTRDADGKFLSLNYIVKQDKKGNWVAQMNSYQENPEVTTTQYSQPLLLEERPVTTTTQVTTNQVTTNTNGNMGNGGIGISVVDPVTGQAVNMNVNVNANGTAVNAGVSGTGVTSTTTTTTTTTSTNGGVTINETHTNGYGNNDHYDNDGRGDHRGDGNGQGNGGDHRGGDHYMMQGYSGNVGCPWPMNANDFQSAKASIASKSFEDSKLTIAKQVTSANCLFCSQVREIMALFSFEASKLEYAKFAYSHVYDQGNYFKLNDAFTFESSIDELNTFINGGR